MWAAKPAPRRGLRSLQTPTLLMVGDRDIVTPEHAVEMYRTIPGAQLCVVANAGHGVMPAKTVIAFAQDQASDRGSTASVELVPHSGSAGTHRLVAD